MRGIRNERKLLVFHCMVRPSHFNSPSIAAMDSSNTNSTSSWTAHSRRCCMNREPSWSFAALTIWPIAYQVGLVNCWWKVSYTPVAETYPSLRAGYQYRNGLPPNSHHSASSSMVFWWVFSGCYYGLKTQRIQSNQYSTRANSNSDGDDSIDHWVPDG